MAGQISSLWFIRLRWFAFFAQMVILGVALFFLELTLPWLELLLLLLINPLSSILARTRLLKGVSENQLVGMLLSLDTLLLTAILYRTGGPTNPFTVVYLVHVILAAVMLSSSWSWLISILSSLGYAFLFSYSRGIPEFQHHDSHHGFSLHLYGMLFAFITVALLITYFLTKIVGDLRKSEREYERLKNSSMNQQRLASLARTTAGAAHELGTPLATITVIAHELERVVLEKLPDEEVLDDIRLLKEEAAKCKVVLEALSAKTGDLLGEAPQSLKVGEYKNNWSPPTFNIDEGVYLYHLKNPSESLNQR